MCCLFNFGRNIFKQSKDTIHLFLRYRSKEPPFIFFLSVQHIFMYINTLRLTTLIIYSSKTLSICNFAHHLFSQNTYNLSSRCQQFSTRRGGRFRNQLCNITAKPNKSVYPISLKKYILYIGMD